MNRREFFLANLGGLALVAGVGALVSRCAPLAAVLLPAKPPQIGLRGWKAGSTQPPVMPDLFMCSAEYFSLPDRQWRRL